jgi:hypothetical protein
MKTPISLVMVMAVLIMPSFVGAADLGSIHLRFLEGDVMVKTEDTADWVPASINMPFYESDRLWVSEGGRAELQLQGGSVVRLGSNSSLDVLASRNDVTQFYLLQGQLYGNVKADKATPLFLETPTASVRAYGKALFKMDVTDSGDSQLSVLKGEVYLDRQAGQMRVAAGERIILKKDAVTPVLAKVGPADQWEQWNRQRDGDFQEPALSSGARYLPDELRVYSGDLDRNGSWSYVAEYGYVWAPRVVVVDAWSPYRMGRWVWMHGDYVWISYEPWGWAPYHYGRWAWTRPLGWCWVPPRRGAVYWGPGFVAWVQTPSHVSWVPLAPREIYYGRGYHGPYSVNATQVDVHRTMVNNVYKNVNGRNGVITLHRDTFVSGKSVNVNLKENPFTKERRITPVVDIKPDRSTVRPVLKEVPRAKLPPQTVNARRYTQPVKPPVVGSSQTTRPGSAGAVQDAGKKGPVTGRQTGVPQNVTGPVADQKKPDIVIRNNSMNRVEPREGTTKPVPSFAGVSGEKPTARTNPGSVQAVKPVIATKPGSAITVKPVARPPQETGAQRAAGWRIPQAGASSPRLTTVTAPAASGKFSVPAEQKGNLSPVSRVTQSPAVQKRQVSPPSAPTVVTRPGSAVDMTQGQPRVSNARSTLPSELTKGGQRTGGQDTARPVTDGRALSAEAARHEQTTSSSREVSSRQRVTSNDPRAATGSTETVSGAGFRGGMSAPGVGFSRTTGASAGFQAGQRQPVGRGFAR